MDFFRISPVSIAPLAELMFSLVITSYFLSVRNKTFDTWLVTIHSGISTCMFALNFITTATLHSGWGVRVEKLQYMIIACLALFNVLFAYLFGGNPFKKEMTAWFTLLLLLFGLALYVNRIAFPYTLPVYVLSGLVVLSVFVRKARRSAQNGSGIFAGETRAYRGFAVCFLFYLLINLTASFGVAGFLPPALWMLAVQVFIYAYLFSFLISFLNYTRAPVSFVTRLEGALLYLNLMILGALGLLLFGVEEPDESGRHALNILAVLIPLSTLGIVTFVPFFFRRSLLRPLRRVLEGMRRVDAGDLSGEVPVTTNDEIGILTQSFNRMTGSLRQYSLQMESLVAARTAELRSRQKKLEDTLKELKATQHKLRTATEQKNRFFDNVTHELKTPLTLILAPVEHLAASSSLHQKEDLQAIRLIDRNAKNLLNLVNRLLDLSKIESGELTLHETPGIIPAVTGRIVQDFRVLAGRKQVDLKYENFIPEDPVLFDHERWEQITANLLSNAVKFCYSGGSVHVSTHLSGNTEAVLTVSDTGMGIPGNELKNIFERFHRVKNLPDENRTGTGLGLALVKELCNLMEGKVEVRSRPGKGTTFTVSVPVGIPAQCPVKTGLPENNVLPGTAGIGDTAANSGNLPGKARPLVLIVEDNRDLLDFLCILLAPQYRVLTAVNGREGLSVARKELPDVIISDVMMPELDGFGFLKSLKEDMRTSHIGVILLTAKTDDKSRIEGLLSGADQYLYKPFYPVELKLRLHNLLANQEKARRYFERHFVRESAPMPESGASDLFLNRLFKIMEDNLDNLMLGPEMLASEMAMSVRTLNRKISSLTGLATAALVRDYRLKKAAAMLLSGKTVADAAYSSGFDNPSYFSTAFKARFHQTPKEFRQK